MISYLCSLKYSHRPNYTSTIVDELSRSQALLKYMYICDLISENQPLPANSSLEKISSKVGVVTYIYS